MVPMPVRELDELDGRETRMQPPCIALPYILFGACVEEDGMLHVVFGRCLF